ncbi:MAG TPA: metal-sulfur cluster assembly factor [Terriglobales bacterium]|jgi:metal-sulfur cluster biosynthetic enzyme
MAVSQEQVLSALTQCFDPEIPVNIVDLGMICKIQFAPAPGNQQDVTVDVTMTSKGSPAQNTIGDQIKTILEQIPGIRHATMNLVATPQWSPERLSVAAKRQLGVE